jgi:hypothetical protein
MMKFSQAISWVKWLSGEKTAQPLDLADSPRKLHNTETSFKITQLNLTSL